MTSPLRSDPSGHITEPVTTYFIRRTKLRRYIGNIFDNIYCEEWAKPWKIEPVEFFKLRTEFWKKHIEKAKIELSPIKIYWKNMFCRVIWLLCQK